MHDGGAATGHGAQSAEPADVNYPDSFYCPITRQLMVDPYVDREGNSYERSAILEWLQNQTTSPVTRSPLNPSDLAPNRALKDLIQSALASASTGNCEPGLSADPGELPDPVPLERAKLKLSAEYDAATGEALVTLNPLAQGPRRPVDAVCVIDVSGSMGSSADVKTRHGVEHTGLTVLDVVKHALKTVIATLGPNDRLALVPFASTAYIAFDFTRMDTPGKVAANKIVEELNETSSTNIWGGLKTGLDLLRKLKPDPYSARLAALYLLTDGQPTDEPPKGTVRMFRQYVDTHKLPAIVNTFGFGYNLDGELLTGVAKAGCGTFAFIPDAGMVGTVFVNALANLLTTYARDVYVAVEDVTSDSPQTENTSWGVAARLGSVQFGQPRSFVVRASCPDLQIKAEFEGEISMETISAGPPRHLKENVERLNVVKAIMAAMEKATGLDSSTPEFEAPVISDGPLKRDLDGQIRLAFKEEYFHKWGKYYLPSIANAHLLQQCNNFKDPGVQVYGGTGFSELREQIDDLFNNLPPMRPSGHAVDEGGSFGSTLATTTRMATAPGMAGAPCYRSAPVNMSTYNNRADPCFTGDSLVTTFANGKKVRKRAKCVERGDYVETGFGTVASVIAVVKYHVLPRGKGAVLSTLPGGSRISAWHPVFFDGRWQFPVRFALAEYHADVTALYNFVLDSEHTVELNGVPAVTLGHGQTGDVREHPFLGTAAAVVALKAMPGFEEGLIGVSGVMRDPATGLISGFMPATFENEE